MKFNVLVVAAMVITSVNAKWYDVFTGCFRGRCPLNIFKSSKHTKFNPICDIIVKELADLRKDAYDIEAAFRSQLSDYSNLMKGMDAKGKKINPRMLKAEQVFAHRALSNEDKAKVDGFKTVYAVVMENYRKTWEKLMKNGCSIKSLSLFSPGEMIKRGPFP
ncbi:hypothetical protein BASA50_010250 [Batrachochytrium salamandrivorans]|uniref:Uncharacterized protein n=1 Tax=Batrachochytrium salamandrivorans TaxID=1357716 RepID=A0ABQ8F1U5_9FUNG|nr:hypothetical protein BASA50_010250 [Batrachochytrium salamandrivorans]KAH6599337.1 hypothetical protein BASA61_002593 [Batrachochytrium salamandrivorans]KAH9247645.1 hypothetical protein BASA81_014728 [Batrachochytrium salamandrivorans]KAH9273333.1 hypothetical protein BASA83_004332 [Batrachochytrium salamandrivorans]